MVYMELLLGHEKITTKSRISLNAKIIFKHVGEIQEERHRNRRHKSYIKTKQQLRGEALNYI
jgi:hypothetical protein